jgi:hypothetical protein
MARIRLTPLLPSAGSVTTSVPLFTADMERGKFLHLIPMLCIYSALLVTGKRPCFVSLSQYKTSEIKKTQRFVTFFVFAGFKSAFSNDYLENLSHGLGVSFFH